MKELTELQVLRLRKAIEDGMEQLYYVTHPGFIGKRTNGAILTSNRETFQGFKQALRILGVDNRVAERYERLFPRSAQLRREPPS